MPGKYAALVLSRGEQFMPPALTPRAHGWAEWPDNSIVHTTFYDSSGGVILDIDGDVTPSAITFDVDPEEVDIVPAGAHYETFLDDSTGRPHQIRYGQVIRKQAQFFTPPTRSIVAANQLFQFADNFYSRTGLVGNKWVILDGQPTIFDNSEDENPNGVGPERTFRDKAAMRYRDALNTDSFRLSFTLLNPGNGLTTIAAASDAAGSSYTYVAFDSLHNKVRMGRGTGLYTHVDQTSEVSLTLEDNTNFKLRYDDLTKKLALLDSEMSTEIITWTDETGIITRGQGYRHVLITWQASVLSSGPQLTSISGQDGT
jgi:hypothetical protein